MKNEFADTVIQYCAWWLNYMASNEGEFGYLAYRMPVAEMQVGTKMGGVRATHFDLKAILRSITQW